jgi:hypothetical protein
MFYPLVSGREGGSGLGLTIAQNFVQHHHGTIDCAAGPGIRSSRCACRSNRPEFLLLFCHCQRQDEPKNHETGLDRRRRSFHPLGPGKDPVPRGHPVQEFCLGQRGHFAARTGHRAAAGADVRHPHARPVRAGIAAGSEDPLPVGAGHHHDRLFRSGKRRCRLSGRRLRIPAQALRRRSGGRADPAGD